MEPIRAQDLKNHAGIVIFVGVAGLLCLSWGAKAVYGYVDANWLSLRCSVLKEQYAKSQLEFAERRRLEAAGSIEPQQLIMPESLVGDNEPLPTFEDYKSRQQQMADSYNAIHRRIQREKECGIGT